MKVEKKRINIIDFGEEYAGLTNSALFEKIYVENEIVTALKKSENLYIFELFDPTNKKPLFTFVYNKGFMKGKVFCILLSHAYNDDKWNTTISEPFIKDGENWVSGKFRTKAREEEFTKIIQSGIIWE